MHFHEKLSSETVYLRYLENLKLDQRIAHERLTRICFIDYDQDMTLVAITGPEGSEEVIAVARLIKLHGLNEAEFSVLVRDDFQRRGLGAALLDRSLTIARDENIASVLAFMLPENLAMQKIATRSGFVLHPSADNRLVVARRSISPVT